MKVCKNSPNGGRDKEMSIQLDLFQAGYCTHKAHVVLQDEKRETMKFPAIFALINHPRHGYILFDTGYAERFYEATNPFPYSIYAKVTPVFFNAGESAIDQLKDRGIMAQDISFVFISHFHADHIAGLKDFPDSQFICSKTAYDSIKNKKGIRALKAGFIPHLLPNDLMDRITFIEDCKIFEEKSACMRHEQQEFIKTYELIFDVFGDGTLLSVDLSGHATGQFGLFFKVEQQYIFLVADAVWRSRSYREKVYPKSIAKLIMSDSVQYSKNLDKLHNFHQSAPNVLIIPSHCEEVLEGAWKT